MFEYGSYRKKSTEEGEEKLRGDSHGLQSSEWKWYRGLKLQSSDWWGVAVITNTLSLRGSPVDTLRLWINDSEFSDACKRKQWEQQQLNNSRPFHGVVPAPFRKAAVCCPGENSFISSLGLFLQFLTNQTAVWISLSHKGKKNVDSQLFSLMCSTEWTITVLERVGENGEDKPIHIFMRTTILKCWPFFLPNEMDETGAHYTEWSKPER